MGYPTGKTFLKSFFWYALKEIKWKRVGIVKQNPNVNSRGEVHREIWLNFSHIFKSNTKFELLCKCGPKVNILVKYVPPLLPPFAHACLYEQFYFKKVFYKANIKDGQKVPWESVPLISSCILYRKINNFSCKIFVTFEVFSNSAAWWQNLRLVHSFSYFSDFLTPMLTLDPCWYRNGTFRG